MDAPNHTDLKSIPIDRESPLPLREQLGKGIANLIGNGHFPPGERLPSIKELAVITGVGASTVRSVVADLTRRRLVYTKPKSGIYVAKPRSGLTQILVSAAEISRRRILYYHQILEGLQAAYAGTGQRIIMTFGTKEMDAPEELVHDALGQGVDSVVAYDPYPLLAAAFAQLAPTLGFVSLMALNPDPRVDQVQGDPSAALREVLLDRIVAGRKTFAYAAVAVEHPLPAPTPQTRLRQTFLETIQAARLQPIEIVADNEPEVVARVGKLPRRCVVVAQSALAARAPKIQKSDLDLVVYTDSRESLELLRDRCTVLYLGLERLAGEAVALLKTTTDRLAAGQGRVRNVPAVIYRPEKMGQRTTACPP